PINGSGVSEHDERTVGVSRPASAVRYLDARRSSVRLGRPALNGSPTCETHLMAATPVIQTLDDADLRSAESLTHTYQQMTEQLSRVIVGQSEVLKQVLIALFCQGHCILEGVPGLAKTLMISTIAQLLSLTFRRIQFTPDLMPSDITGTEILDEEEGTGRRRMRFVKGPIFANILLGDEINRTPPKTQAALLQAM